MGWLDGVDTFVEARRDRLGGWVFRWVGNAFAYPFRLLGLVDADGNAIGAANLIEQAISDVDMPPAMVANLRAAGSRAGWFTQLYMGGIAAFIKAASVLATIRPVMAMIEQGARADVRPELLTKDELMEALKRGVATEGHVDNELRAYGFLDDDIAVMKDLTHPLLDLDAIRNLFWRGSITATTADSLLAQLGYNEVQRADLFSLFAALPSVDEHIQMAVRQVFNPELRQALGLDEDYPEALTPNIAKVGLSEEWARNIWAAHWQIPSPTQLFEMVFRGVIDPTLLNQGLRDAGYSPLWRDKLLEINRRLVTRVDGRRLFDTGIWDQPRLVRHFTQLGYAPDDAKDLAEWTVKNATEGDQLRKHRVKSLTEGMVTHALETYVIHSDTAREMLSGLNYTTEEIYLLVSAAEYRRDQAAVKEVESAVKHNYTRGEMPRAQAVTTLAGLGLATDRIDRLMAAWDLLFDSTYLTQHAHHLREIAKGDVVLAYEGGVMHRQEATSMLLDLGYPAKEVELLLATADVKIAKAAKKEHLDTIHFQFVNGQIDQAAASVRLDQMNLRGGERDYLIAKWLHEAHRGTTNLTEKDIGDLFGAKIITISQVAAELTAKGFSALHVQWLTKLIQGSGKVDARGYLT